MEIIKTFTVEPIIEVFKTHHYVNIVYLCKLYTIQNNSTEVKIFKQTECAKKR